MSEPQSNGQGMQVNKPRDGKQPDKDDEGTQLKGQLSEAIVTEKPNVKWTDIAGY